MTKRNKISRVIKAIKEDEFWSYSNPLIPIVLVIIIAGIIIKIVS